MILGIIFAFRKCSYKVRKAMQSLKCIKCSKVRMLYSNSRLIVVKQPSRQSSELS